jgi:ATP-binding cassette subfamily F protein 3
MALAQFADVHFGYPGREILTGASWQIRPGDRVALLGPNGTGKSTALRLLAGELAPDAGDVRILGKATVAYLVQSQELTSGGTLLESLVEPFAELQALRGELQEIEARLGAASGTPDILHRYGALQERYLRGGGYEVEARVRRLLEDVGFSEDDLHRGVGTLSGGERGRLELAKILVRRPDLLLLDEPTNHLDLAAIERLETFLAEYEGAFVLISHDRAFVQRTCREIVEIEGGRFVRYPGSYERYTAGRAVRLERARVAHERQSRHVQRTEDFIRRNLAGQRTKQAQSRRKMLEKLERLEKPEDHWELAGQVALRFATGGEPGSREAIRATSLAVGYPGRTIVAGLTLNVYRGERLGIVGPNGCGKSTLLRTLVGDLPPLGGHVELGVGVRLGYYDQRLEVLDEGHSLIAELRTVRADMSPEALRAYLARFRFSGDDSFRAVGGLSGGERSRLALAKMMLFPRNLLALDEPTNHLDIPAREVLEEALRAYDGTLVVVSHDRYFLDRACTRLVVMQPEGVELHPGNFSDWRARACASVQGGLPRNESAAAPPLSSGRLAPPKPEARPAARSEAQPGRRATREQQRAARKAARATEVAALEQELAAVREQLMRDPAGRWQQVHALVAREREIEEVLRDGARTAGRRPGHM